MNFTLARLKKLRKSKTLNFINRSFEGTRGFIFSLFIIPFGYFKNNDLIYLFFSKFKNLMDDYIVNYQVKYIFYYLFMFFFIFEFFYFFLTLFFFLSYNSCSFEYFGFYYFLLDLCVGITDNGIYVAFEGWFNRCVYLLYTVALGDKYVLFVLLNTSMVLASLTLTDSIKLHLSPLKLYFDTIIMKFAPEMYLYFVVLVSLCYFVPGFYIILFLFLIEGHPFGLPVVYSKHVQGFKPVWVDFLTGYSLILIFFSLLMYFTSFYTFQLVAMFLIFISFVASFFYKRERFLDVGIV